MYKVVSKVDNKFYSSFVNNNAKIEYKIGELTFPVIDNTKIFVFKSFDDASLYSLNIKNTNVFKCNVVNPTTKNSNFINPVYLTKDYTDNITFEKIKTLSQYDKMFKPPHGSVFIEAIELTELVQDENGTVLPTVDELYNLFIKNNWKGLVGPAGCYTHNVEKGCCCAIPALLKFNNKLLLKENFDIYNNTNDLFQNFVNISKLDAVTLIYQGFDNGKDQHYDIEKYRTEPLYRLGRDLYLKLRENDLLFKN